MHVSSVIKTSNATNISQINTLALAFPITDAAHLINHPKIILENGHTFVMAHIVVFNASTPSLSETSILSSWENGPQKLTGFAKRGRPRNGTIHFILILKKS